ncbi:peptidase S8 [Anaerobacillus alkaliphilus]|uniref:Peptidase S8 n=1 Tax=Anaerobacillus alkaliphilus TaxID=1548597 RepID=A0A4Q0VXQ7_9BACI|nr:S8 family peptidase [Anaerobacillus alkaliphilus]RXJ04474.1 peptidase S8 [Anaerobacillus alkaliphilus]
MATMKRLLVCFKPGTDRSTCLKMHKEMKATLVNEIKEIDIHVVTVSSDEVPTCLTRYASTEGVRFVEEDHLIQVEPVSDTNEVTSKVGNSTITTNDPLSDRQWGLENVNAQGAWDLARISPISARIAILDTGVNRNHPDLRGKVIHNANFSSSSTVEDVHGHGTHVAGIAAALTNNRNGIAGMSYNAAGIMNIKVLGDTGSGTNSNVAEGIIYAANRGAHVVNMSFGSAQSNETLQMAINYANDRGVLLVGAAGNNSSNLPHYPAAYTSVLSVAATNQSNELAPFSNYGTWVDVAAPGQNILSTFPVELEDSMYRVASGTSMATPFVSGLAGLIKATNSALTNREIRSIIERAATQSISGGTIRFGRIDAMRAILIAPTSRRQRQRTSNRPSVWLNTQ